MAQNQIKILGILISLFLLIMLAGLVVNLEKDKNNNLDGMTHYVTSKYPDTIMVPSSEDCHGADFLRYQYFDNLEKTWKGKIIWNCGETYYNVDASGKKFDGPFWKDESFKTKSPSSQYVQYINGRFGFDLKIPDNFIVVDQPSVADNHYGLVIKDAIDGIQYIAISIFKGDLASDATFQGPFPKTIPADGKNGDLTVIHKMFNDISVFELYGNTSEGHEYADYLSFERNGYIWRIILNPVGEGRISAMSCENNTNLDREAYISIRDSFGFEYQRLGQEKWKAALELGKAWTNKGYISDFGWIATSTDGTHSIRCEVLPNQNFRFIAKTELVVRDSLGHEKRYENSQSICPFKWIGNVVYGVISEYESSGQIVKMEVDDNYVPGKVTDLGFESNGIFDSSRRYYVFMNSQSDDPQYNGVQFCAGGDILPDWQRADQLGIMDVETGEIIVLLSDKNKVYDIEGWSRNSPDILYREYTAPKISSDTGIEYYCPDRKEGKLFSINIFTRKITDQSAIQDAYFY